MNKITFLAITLSAVTVAIAQEPQPPTLGELLSESGWTVEELLVGLDRLEAKYNRDVANVSGRKQWHGNLISEVYNTNTLTKVEIYEDGTEFTFPFTIRTAAQSATRMNSKLSLTTNGVPAKLAAARAARAARTNDVETTTVNITAGESAQ